MGGIITGQHYDVAVLLANRAFRTRDMRLMTHVLCDRMGSAVLAYRQLLSYMILISMKWYLERHVQSCMFVTLSHSN